MNSWHEMDVTVHSQFGTVDNPVLIFTSDSSWRIVICMGPGVEDDSYAHEKMFYFVREGPINRCHVCGQCFKIVRLKYQNTLENEYYSTMFAAIDLYEVQQEEDFHIPIANVFTDRPHQSMQVFPGLDYYIYVNNDEMDRIMVDPAYKLEKLKMFDERIYAFNEAVKTVESQVDELNYKVAVPYGRDLYENWYNIEKSIMKFDRIFNKLEKFHARSMSDPFNHERREKRMNQKKLERWNENYTYFFGGLTEEEQQYRDYFQTDLELNPEDEFIDEKFDDYILAGQGQFNTALYDFQDYTVETMGHEDYSDLIEDKLFKFKYRQFGDNLKTYERR